MDPLAAGNDGYNFDLPPHLMSQPPQIFGGYNADGSPVQPAMAGSMFGDSQEQGSNDENDPKRRRIARACDMCRKKKIKCDGRMPACSHCINYKTECIFTQVEKKRNPPKGAKYIEGLENRLGRMESLLKMSGLLSDQEAGKTDLGTLEKRLAEKVSTNGDQSRRSSSRPASASANQPRAESPQKTPQRETHTSPQDSITSPVSDADRERNEEVENLSDMMCSLVTNNCGETRYIGTVQSFGIGSTQADLQQDHHPASRSSPRKEYNGLMRRPAIAPFKK